MSGDPIVVEDQFCIEVVRLMKSAYHNGIASISFLNCEGGYTCSLEKETSMGFVGAGVGIGKDEYEALHNALMTYQKIYMTNKTVCRLDGCGCKV